MTKTIVSITGIRSDYDLMTPVYRAIQNSKSLKLELIVTGAHLSPLYGETIDLIKEDGFPIAKTIHSLLSQNEDWERPKGLATQLGTLCEYFSKNRPDILLALGDREEALVSGILAQYMNIPLVHVSGGDRVVGNVDDQVRHAVSHMAHIHLTTNKESADRLKKMGEQDFRIHVVGSPGLDRFKNSIVMTRESLAHELNLPEDPNQPWLVLLQHPLSTEIAEAESQMKTTLDALQETKLHTVIIYPNSDAGSKKMIEQIELYRNHPQFHIHKNLPGNIFANLLKEACVLLGNSSAGLLEAPFIGLPVINIGNRQKMRLHGDNIIFVNHDKDEIQNALNKAMNDQSFIAQCNKRNSPYGDGQSADRIVKILEELKIDEALMKKELSY